MISVFKAHRHANKNVLFEIPGTTFVVMWLFRFHEYFPLALAYSFNTCRLLKSSSNMILTLLLFLFEGTSTRESKFPFQNPGDHIRRYVFLFDSMTIFPWLWLIVSKLVACWNPPPIWFRLYYYFCFKAHRHANRHLLFKIPGTTFVVMCCFVCITWVFSVDFGL